MTTSINGMSALEELRQHPNHYDLVLSDVYMPGGSVIMAAHERLLAVDLSVEDLQADLTDYTINADMDGFKLLEHIGLELDLPVISESRAACFHWLCSWRNSLPTSE